MHAELPAQEQITAVIPIRGGSERCLSKSIRPFYDTCLLDLRVKVLRQTKGIHRIQVNSDCDAVLARARELGVEVFKREARYATSKTDGKMLYECLSSACPTGIMLIAFAPTPFIEASDYDTCIDVFKEQNYDSVISVQHKKDYMFLDKKAVNFDPLKTCRSQDLPKYYSMTFGVTIVRTEFVRKHHSIWTPSPYFYEVDELKAMDIDTNMDFIICEHIYKMKMRSISDINTFMNTQQQKKCCRITVDNMEDLPEDLYLGAVYDALNMVVDDPEKYVLGMKPMAGYEKLVHGPAFTIGGAHANKTDDFDALTASDTLCTSQNFIVTNR